MNIYNKMPGKKKAVNETLLNWSGIETNVECVDVYDGDTITVSAKFSELVKKYEPGHDISGMHNIVTIKCRMFGYNSAELRTKDAEEKAKGVESRDYLSSMILGQTVRIRFHSEHDMYGRELVDVYIIGSDGTPGLHINAHMMETGHGMPYSGKGEKKW